MLGDGAKVDVVRLAGGAGACEEFETVGADTVETAECGLIFSLIDGRCTVSAILPELKCTLPFCGDEL